MTRKLLMTTAAAAVSLSTMACAHDDEAISNFPAASLSYQTTPEGVAFAPLMGDRFEESYMAMVRLPAGLTSPPHIKSANMFGVMISGAMVHVPVQASIAEEVILPEGSFYKIPAGVAHVSKCVSDVECVTFLYQDGKFDFIPVEK